MKNFQTIETNQRSGFQVLSIAGVPFVQPLPSALTGDQVAALQGAARVALLGRRKVAEAIVAHVQRDLGVSPDLHALALTIAGGKVAKAQRLAREQKAGTARRQVVRANRTVAEPEPSKEVRRAVAKSDDAGHVLRKARAEYQQLHRLAELQAWAAAFGSEAEGRHFAELLQDANRARTATWTALATLRERAQEAADLRRAQLDAFWAAQAVAETADLAQVRGEQLGQLAKAEAAELGLQPLRISSRDGLAVLFEAGSITAHQYGAGRAYRVAYELAGEGLKIANLNPTGVGGGGQAGTLAAHRSARELQRAYVLARLRQIELAAGGRGERELRVLRAVAGEGHTISSLGRAGSARDRNTLALRRALEAAVDVLAAPVQRRLKNEAGR